jgi:hypothetical protein
MSLGAKRCQHVTLKKGTDFMFERCSNDTSLMQPFCTAHCRKTAVRRHRILMQLLVPDWETKQASLALEEQVEQKDQKPLSGADRFRLAREKRKTRRR